MAKAAAAIARETVVAGIRISHPERLIYPDLGISKLQLARYYEAVGEWIVPHAAGRPLTLFHCPDGLATPCRFLKHAKAWGPTALERVRIQEKTKVGEYLVAHDVAGVVSLAQMGIVEIHTWTSTMADLEHPDRLVWDLDPGPRVAWTRTVASARLLRGVLETLGLTSWVKTTGGRGLHIVVPIARRLDWAACLDFARAVAEALVRAEPTHHTITFSKTGRERKILIDNQRNNRTNTSVCAYSTRARPGATVSMPLDWTDLAGGPERFTIETVPRRLARLRRDPWADYWRAAQEISETAVEAIRRV
jgi:bifunctional non-homologous end joining protein LigD